MRVTVLPFAVASGFVLGLAAPVLWRRLPRLAAAAFVALPIALTAILVSLAPAILEGRPARFDLAWIPSLGLDLSFSVDGLGLLFGLLICGIGALVVLYADRYLAGDRELGRFHGMLLAFMASMLGLVLSDNLMLLVVFWGLTGLTSFLLIGFEHHQGTSRRAASQALIVTVAGEMAMLAGLVLLGRVTGTYSLSSLSTAGELVRADPVYPLVLVLVLLGAATKSAQVPFHFWLPNAMAAPTPVSAYLHSATMVTAGVYLLARLAPVLAGTGLWSILLVGVGGLTLLLGGGLSLRQRDLKRILAYSTIGALGLMVMLLGVDMPGAAVAAMAVLLAHALYKGALFLVTGAVDHETGTRDIERLRGLGGVMPFTALAAGLAALSIAGLPPLLGFAAKELGLKAAIADPTLGILLVVVSVVGGAMFVAVAAIVAVGPFLIGRRPDDASVREADWRLWVSPLALGLGAAAAGLLPWLGASDLLGAAAGAIMGDAVTAEVAPWYGIDAALLLSGLSLLAGGFLFLRRSQVRTVAARLDLGHRFGSEKAYVVLERGLNASAARLTGTLQNGRLRLYLMVVVSTLLVLEWPILIASGGLSGVELSSDVFIWELGVAGAIVGGAIMVVRAESRLSAVTALGIVGYGIAITYLLFGAPDLAMAQILVETLTLLVFVLVFYHLPRMSAVSARASRLRDAALALASGALLTVFILAVSSGPSDPISSFFEVASQPLAHGRNVVNVILVDFRGLDTLGEVTVLAVAAFGVFSLLKLRARDGDRA